MRNPRPRRVGSTGTRKEGEPLPAEKAGADAEVIAGLASGDAQALANLYDRYAPVVYGVLLRMLQNTAVAEELLQEVFWTLWRRPERFDARRGSLRVFLFQLGRSRALDHLRRERRRSSLLREGPALLSEDPERSVQSNPFLAAVSAEDRFRVREALAALPQAHQRVLALSYFEGLSHSEIAEQLGEPLGTVKTRIRGGLARMRTRLSGDETTEQSFNEV